MNIKDFAIGGVAGAALAVVGTLYFSGTGAAASSAPTAAVAAPQPPAPASAASGAASVAGKGGVPTVVMPAAQAAACPPALAAADPRKPASAAAVAAPGAVRADVPAIALSAEHAKILLDESARPLSMPELHARFAGEPLDPAWSQQMESQIRQSLQEAGVQKGFELLAVECRRTLCELRLFGAGADSGQRWSAVSGQLTQQSWWPQNFSGTSSSTTDINGRAVIATLLHRAKH